MQLIGVGGTKYAERTETVSFDANCATRLATLQEPLATIEEEIFFLDLQLLDLDGLLLCQNRYAFSHTANLRPLLDCPAAKLTVSSSAGENKEILTLTNHGDMSAMFIWLEDARDLNASGSIYFDDNYFCLLPNESRTVTVLWQDVLAGERRLEVSSWNAKTIYLDLSVNENFEYGIERST